MAAEPGDLRPPSTGDDGPTPLALAGLGLQWFVAVLAFVYAGNWVDRQLGSTPVALLVGLFVGGGGVFYVSVRRLLDSGTRESGTRESGASDPSSSSARSESTPDVD